MMKRFALTCIVLLIGIPVAAAALDVDVDEISIRTSTVAPGINYQGLLMESGGNPITTSAEVTFHLYDVAEGGTAIATDTHVVEIENGLFTTTLTFEPAYYDGRALWLEISFRGEVLEPRQELRPVPYALGLVPGVKVEGLIPTPIVQFVNNEGTAVEAVSVGDFGHGMRAIADGNGGTGIISEVYGVEGLGLGVVTHEDWSKGIAVDTNGYASEGIQVQTIGDYASGLNVSTSGQLASGIRIETDGQSSKGVGVLTNHNYSQGMTAETYGWSSEGFMATTYGSTSAGVKATTYGSNSPGAEIETISSNSPGLSITTQGSDSEGVSITTQHSDGVRAVTYGYSDIGVAATTYGDESEGVYAHTEGEFSEGVIVDTRGYASNGVSIFTWEDVSRGVSTDTYGQSSHGVMVYTDGIDSYGVHTSSKQSVGVYADTHRNDHKWGLFTDDYIYAKGTQYPAVDVAEYFPVEDAAKPGTVMIIGSKGTLLPSTTAYDSRVAGIVSTDPAISLGANDTGNPGKAQIAIAGRVPCKVDASYGAIQPGDLLTTSDTPGYAMKAVPVELQGHEFYPDGTILGKALEPLDEGTGVIEVLVTLQ